MFFFFSLLCLFPLNFHSKFEMYCMMIIMGGVVFLGFTQYCMLIITGKGRVSGVYSVLYDDYYGWVCVSGIYSTGAGARSGPALKRFLVMEKEKFFMMMQTYCVRMSSAWGTTH